jgi:hypothetical protein
VFLCKQVGQIFEFVESIGAMLRLFSRLALLARGINKGPSVLLDGARPPPKYVFKNNFSLTKLKIQSTQTISEKLDS